MNGDMATSHHNLATALSKCPRLQQYVSPVLALYTNLQMALTVPALQTDIHVLLYEC
jgi:hypothetical protein